MESSRRRIDGAIILVDDAAEWVVAGLPQIDRILLALNEYFSNSNPLNPTPILVLPRSTRDAPRASRQHRHLTHLSLMTDKSRFAGVANLGGQILLVNTCLIIERSGIARMLDELPDTARPFQLLSSAEIFQVIRLGPELMNQMEVAGRQINGTGAGCYLFEQADIPAAETWLLSTTAKSQDGVIARYLNRPISRAVSRILLHYPITPNQWSAITTLLPIAGAIFLSRGDRSGFVIGAVLFQLQNVLDGCDGEIARLKYLESKAGTKIDGLCDRIATMLLAVGLGIGLSRHFGVSGNGYIYFWESIIAAALIGISETLLQRKSMDEHLERADATRDLSPTYVRSHQNYFNPTDQLKIWAIKNSGMLLLGDRATSFFVQLTKRDVFNFGFALLIILGWPQWTLHILAGAGCLIAILAIRDMIDILRDLRSRRSQSTAHQQQLSSVEKKSVV